MFERADAWRDCPSTPERLAEINRLTAAFYADRFPGSWAQPYLASRFGVDLTGHADLQPGYAPNGWTTLITTSTPSASPTPRCSPPASPPRRPPAG